MSSWRLLISWMKSSGVSRVTVLRSLLATTVAQLSANALSIGAPLLLCLAWTQQHWTNPLQRIAIPLVIIELLAFFRSPLRYLDRMHAHRLGFAAVTQWRTWLTRRVATWSFRSTANTSRAELLQQSVSDIDHLQDVWLRVAVPLVASVVSFLISLGIVIEVLARQSAVVQGETLFIGILLLVALLVFVILMSQLNRAVSSVRVLNQAHQKGFEELFDRAQLATELSLLGAAAQDQKQDSQAQRQQSQPYNNAPTWRDVRSGQEAYTSIKGPETGILIQSGGETWRQIRNGPVTVIGGWAVVAMLLVIGLFYKAVFADKVET
ncbi:MAG: hypothetical protein WCL31_07910, partial [Actinomycetes bacterium]